MNSMFQRSALRAAANIHHRSNLTPFALRRWAAPSNIVYASTSTNGNDTAKKTTSAASPADISIDELLNSSSAVPNKSTQSAANLNAVPFTSESGEAGTGELATDWSKSYSGLSQEPFAKEVADILLAPIDPEDIEMKPGKWIRTPIICSTLT